MAHEALGQYADNENRNMFQKVGSWVSEHLGISPEVTLPGNVILLGNATDNLSRGQAQIISSYAKVRSGKHIFIEGHSYAIGPGPKE